MRENLKDLPKRFFVSSVFIFVIFFLIVFSDLKIVSFLLFCFLACMGAIATFEYVFLAEEKKIFLSKPLMVTASICEVAAFSAASFSPSFKLAPLIVIFVFFVALFILNFSKIENALIRISTSTFGFLYISVPLGMLIYILFSPSIHGKIWTAFILIVTKITDVAAYFGGKLLGRKKLASFISPNKTFEGAVLGFLFAVSTAVIFYFLGDVLGPKYLFLKSYKTILLGIFLAIAAQIGDLSESLLKRDANVKDSNKLKGMGGILDMLDSLLFTIPIVYFFLIV